MLHDRKLRVFWITTGDAEHLAEELASRLPGSAPVVVDKFDYRCLPRGEALANIDQTSFFIKSGSLPSNGAIGCALAHRYCYERTLEEGCEHALILEDDVEIGSIDFEAVYLAIENISDFDVISLGSRNAVVKRTAAAALLGYKLHRSVYYCLGAYAYVVSRAGATKLLKVQSPKLTWFSDWPIHAWRMKLYLMLPSQICLSNRPTGVQTPTSRGRVPTGAWLIYRLRLIIWSFIGLVRIKAFGDLRVEES